MQISAAEPSRQNAATLPAPRPQPTLPSGKLPQYRWGLNHGLASSNESLEDPNLTFLLTLPLPSQTILVRAAVTIDGQPFPQARERRIKQILKTAASEPSEAGPPAQDEDKTDGANEPQDVGAEPSAPESEASVPPYALADSAADAVRRYLTATGREALPEEIRWLLSHRIDGPVLLMLNENFQRFRANERPVFQVLDRDRDGAVSAEELQRAVPSIHECDFNRDEIIDYTEIARAAKDPRRQDAHEAATPKLIHGFAGASLADDPDAPPIPARMDANGNRRLDADELPSLHAAEPDLTLAVAFNTADATTSRVTVTAVNDALRDAVAEASVNGETITLPIGGAWVAISAVQAGASDQISLGAVNDGYPLLPVVDPNDDGRFTVRELRELAVRLRRFDRNQDGALTAEEAQPTIRVCFGLGPLVHRELAGVRSVNPRSTPPAVAAPPWFARMDRNKDQDLTRGEFPGTDDQFQELDADQDGLVSGQEAVEFESKSP
jgi:Ca2+-binding EF-hand superfamily protein